MLVLRHRRYYQALAKAGQKKDEDGNIQNEETPPNRNVKHEPTEHKDQRRRQKRNSEIRDRLTNDDLVGFERRGLQLLHGPELFFPNDRQRRGNDSAQHEDQSKEPGNEVFRGLQFRVEQQPWTNVDRDEDMSAVPFQPLCENA